MRLSATLLSDVRADKGSAFWVWFSVKTMLGTSQMAGAFYGLILYLREGPSSATMNTVFIVAGLTTISLLLFKILRWCRFADYLAHYCSDYLAHYRS